MILLTGHGALGESFSTLTSCDIISSRQLSAGQMETLLAQYNVIIHNAANLNPTGPQEAVDDNFLLTKRLIDTAYKVRPDVRFVYLSSMSFLKEEKEYLDIGSMTDYSFSKYLAEVYCIRHPLKKVNVVRCSTIFYSDEKRDGLSKLIYDAVKSGAITLINNGNAKRDFIPVEIVAGYLHKIILREISAKVLTLASANAVSFATVAECLKKRLPSLTIQNKPMDGVKQVLSDFSDSSIKEIGEIDFILEDFIDKYIAAIQS